ncbi:molybdopterin-dependent oxidoreductase [Actinoallomurus acaciae]|uniref:Molybdopterin-dependent oxidoreductase n=1 Tax=Actinoallomurus acaciae TaxID=502577 RepID=A0ABV5Y980_9ACTN
MRKLSPRRVVAAFVAIFAVAFLSSSAVAAPVRSGHSRPAQVVVTGQVQHRRAYTVADLRRFPQHTVTVQFGSSTGTEQHTFTGPLLTDVAAAVGPRFDANVKNDQLRFFVAATGADGYRAIVSWGEIDPAFGARQVLVATAQDGAPLDSDGPRLVVPGDAKGGRYVSTVVQLYIGDADHLIRRR